MICLFIKTKRDCVLWPLVLSRRAHVAIFSDVVLICNNSHVLYVDLVNEWYTLWLHSVKYWKFVVCSYFFSLIRIHWKNQEQWYIKHQSTNTSYRINIICFEIPLLGKGFTNEFCSVSGKSSLTKENKSLIRLKKIRNRGLTWKGNRMKNFRVLSDL